MEVIGGLEKKFPEIFAVVLRSEFKLQFASSAALRGRKNTLKREL